MEAEVSIGARAGVSATGPTMEHTRRGQFQRVTRHHRNSVTIPRESAARGLDRRDSDQ